MGSNLLAGGPPGVPSFFLTPPQGQGDVEEGSGNMGAFYRLAVEERNKTLSLSG